MAQATATTAPSPASADSLWWAPLVMGIVALMIGLLMLAHPAETSVWIAWLVGFYWFVSGILNIVMLFVDRTQWGWKLVLGVLGIFAGLLVLDSLSSAPLLTTIGLAAVYVWVLGIQGVVFGAIQLVQAFKGGGWGIGFLGVMSIFFGGMLIANPVIGGLALPWVFGIFAVVGGIAAMVMAFKLKNA